MHIYHINPLSQMKGILLNHSECGESFTANLCPDILKAPLNQTTKQEEKPLFLLRLPLKLNKSQETQLC